MVLALLAGDLGAPIARGSRSVIHAWGTNAVAKVPGEDVPDGWIRSEALFVHALHRIGVPVPEVLGLTRIGDRDAIVYERIDGPTMWDTVMSGDTPPAAIGHQLAVLHGSLLSRRPPISLPLQRSRLNSKLRMVPDRPVPAIPARVDALRLCHGDFHPKNVILSARGPVIVDWFDATRGDPTCDVARTSVLLRSGPQEHLPGSSNAIVAEVHAAYLEAMRSTPGVKAEDIGDWVRVNAAARLAEGVDPQPLLEILSGLQ